MMGRLLQRIGTATVAFVLLSLVVAVLTGIARVPAGLLAAVLTPVIWGLMVGWRNDPKPGWGALAGALAGCAPCVVLLSLASLPLPGRNPDSLGGQVAEQFQTMLMLAACAAAAGGAFIGARLVRAMGNPVPAR